MKYFVCTIVDNSDKDFELVRFMYNFSIENIREDEKMSIDEHRKYFITKIGERCKELAEENLFPYFTEQLANGIKNKTLCTRLELAEFRKINKHYSNTFPHLYSIEPPTDHPCTYTRNVDPSGPRNPLPDD